MMASLDNKDDGFLAAKEQPANSGPGDEPDPLAGHLFRAEIELHYALLEAQRLNDPARLALLELALATVQSCGPDFGPAPTPCRPQE